MALTIVSVGHAQEWSGVTLGTPRFVATDVESVNWSDDGKCLGYTTSHAGTAAFGVFDLDADKGATLVTLAAGEEIASFDWLKAGKKGVLVVRGQAGGPYLSVTVLDAHESTARQVWTRKFNAGEEPTVEVQVSPLLAHALLTVSSASTRETWVLAAGGNTVVFSRDIATAEGQGQSFADWSKSGTALFSGPAVAGGATSFTLDLSKSDQKVRNGEETLVELAIDRSSTTSGGVTLLSNLPILSRFFIRMRPDIPEGATVLECVPSNGALRPVRFPGYFEPRPGRTDLPDVHSKLTPLSLGKAVAGSNALWLAPNDPQRQAKAERGLRPGDPSTGILVSAQADSWWPAPEFRAIAFSWNKVLFVRTVTITGK